MTHKIVKQYLGDKLTSILLCISILVMSRTTSDDVWACKLVAL